MNFTSHKARLRPLKHKQKSLIRKKKIEEGRANLEAQKQALLARLDKSSEPDVVPGQTDIYDFLGDDEK